MPWENPHRAEWGWDRVVPLAGAQGQEKRMRRTVTWTVQFKIQGEMNELALEVSFEEAGTEHSGLRSRLSHTEANFRLRLE